MYTRAVPTHKVASGASTRVVNFPGYRLSKLWPVSTATPGGIYLFSEGKGVTGADNVFTCGGTQNVYVLLSAPTIVLRKGIQQDSPSIGSSTHQVALSATSMVQSKPSESFSFLSVAWIDC